MDDAGHGIVIDEHTSGDLARDLPAAASARRAGYVRIAQLTTVSTAELLKLHGMGPQATGSCAAPDKRGDCRSPMGEEGTCAPPDLCDDGLARPLRRETAEGHLLTVERSIPITFESPFGGGGPVPEAR
jgi:hypothetical protein